MKIFLPSKKILSAIILCAILVLYNHCGNPFSNSESELNYKVYELPPGQQPPASDGSQTPANPAAIDPAKSVDAFEETVYTLTRTYCINCHGAGQQPVHADPDVKVAHDSVLNSFKVNFQNPASSRLVLKLSQANHNCWSNNCNNDAAMMLAEIEEWKSKIFVASPTTTGGSGGTGIISNGNEVETASSMVISSYFGTSNATDPNTRILNMISSTLKAPMQTAVDAASNLNYIWVPNGNGGNRASNDGAAGWANINFSISQAGPYKMYGLVDAPNDSDNSFFVKIDNGNYIEWRFDGNMIANNGFAWRELTSSSNMTPVPLTLTQGTHMLEVRQREDGTKISTVVFTQNPNFSGYGIYGSPRVTLNFDLAPILNVPATFSIDIQEYDMYSYKLSSPRIISNSYVAVKAIRPYVNEIYNPQHSTYTIVDKIATPTDNILSPYSLILLKDKGPAQDKIIFSFEVLQVVY
ncbi:MAG: hypothetical protein JNM93_12775 [Bacteriovoracaceae bacterium]|nr:hypothetical protein [Bacteriovoracaceae bacterium]